MAQIVIVSRDGGYAGRLSAISAILKARGHDVSLVCEQPSQEQAFTFQALIAPEIDDCYKPGIEWCRNRDYPTLRDGMRRRQIKNLLK